MSNEPNNTSEPETVSSVTTNAEDCSPITLVRKLQDGTLNKSNISIESRRSCVAYLTSQGYSVAQIAEILKMNERQVGRDRAAIRAANAIKRSQSFENEHAGYVMLVTEQSVQHFLRIANEGSCSHADRIEAVRAAVVAVNETTKTLQTLGYLPSATREIRADLTHHIDNQQEDYKQHDADLEQIEFILAQTGNN
jgi:hypothetical protein